MCVSLDPATAIVLSCNQTLVTALGRSKEEIVGQPVFELYHADSLAGARKAFEIFVTTGEVRDAELQLQRRDGTKLNVSLNVTAVRDSNGRILRSRSCWRDITAQKQAEEQVRQLNLTLELRVEERTAELRQALDEVANLKEQLEAENVYLREKVESSAESSDGLVGRGEAWMRLIRRAEQVAPTNASVLLLGETGAGKSRIAQLIHERSERRGQPLVQVNCATLPGTLIESELFGHEKGAFTGAFERRIGRFEVADGGTVLLEEIGDLPPDLQVKLLRVLENGEFERVGSTKTTKVNVRVIAATNRDLEIAVADGSFREDLYYRIGVFPITLPPLRERRDDIPLLTWYFITKLKATLAKTIKHIPQTTMDFLTAYSWPGNVRELENLIERAMILSPGTTLMLEQPAVTATPYPVILPRPTVKRLADLERAHITAVLEDNGWKIKGKGNAAEQLGLHPSTLYARLKKLGIKRPVAGRSPDS